MGMGSIGLYVYKGRCKSRIGNNIPGSIFFFFRCAWRVCGVCFNRLCIWRVQLKICGSKVFLASFVKGYRESGFTIEHMLYHCIFSYCKLSCAVLLSSLMDTEYIVRYH